MSLHPSKHEAAPQPSAATSSARHKAAAAAGPASVSISAAPDPCDIGAVRARASAEPDALSAALARAVAARASAAGALPAPVAHFGDALGSGVLPQRVVGAVDTAAVNSGAPPANDRGGVTKNGQCANLDTGQCAQSVRLAHATLQRWTARWSKPAGNLGLPPKRSIKYIPQAKVLEAGIMTPRAHRVEAVINHNDEWKGTQPGTAWPLGWWWAAMVSIPTASGIAKAHSGWVRFHLLSQACGGHGVVENLVTTPHTVNQNINWRTFEDDQYWAIKGDQAKNIPGQTVAVELEVDYHANLNSSPSQPGDSEIGKFPRTIWGEWWTWHPVQGWLSQGNVQLPIAAPSATPGNVQLVLVDVGERTMTSILKLSPSFARWLDASRPWMNAQGAAATAQGLYDEVSHQAFLAGLGRGLSEINQFAAYKEWPKLDAFLNAAAGITARICAGCAPPGHYQPPKPVSAPAPTPPPVQPPPPRQRASLDDILSSMATTRKMTSAPQHGSRYKPY